MKRSFVSLAGVALTTLFVAACSSSGGGPGNGGSSSGGGGGGSCKSYSACTLATQANVRQAIGADLGAGVEGDANPTPSSNKAELVACTYNGSTAGSVSVTVRCCPCNDNDPASVQAELKQLGEPSTSIGGVGDTAFWVVTGADAGHADYQLHVFVGQSVYIIVTMSSPSSGSFSVDPQQAAVTLARDVIAGL